MEVSPLKAELQKWAISKDDQPPEATPGTPSGSKTIPFLTAPTLTWGDQCKPQDDVPKADQVATATADQEAAAATQVVGGPSNLSAPEVATSNGEATLIHEPEPEKGADCPGSSSASPTENQEVVELLGYKAWWSKYKARCEQDKAWC